MKAIIKRTFIYKWLRPDKKIEEVIAPAPSKEQILLEWENNGRPAPPPHFYKAMTIEEYAVKSNINTLIETGTYLGETVEACLPIFKKIISIELAPELFKNAKAKFANTAKVELYEGDSGEVLQNILPNITEPCLFWLDGHYSEGFTAKGKLNTPIINELNHIFNHQVKSHIILIDDARCFTGEDDYPSIDELQKIVSNHDRNLVFSVKDDIIRIHPDSLH